MPIEFNPLDQTGKNITTREREVTLDDLGVFGNKLREARQKQKKIVKEIAKEFGLSQVNISAWEKWERFPDEDKLPEIAGIYGIDLGELIEAFNISKQARELEKGFTKKLKTIFKENSNF
jgi:transcriptional regulator with XRE-family HTH domain